MEQFDFENIWNSILVNTGRLIIFWRTRQLSVIYFRNNRCDTELFDINIVEYQIFIM
jgi:hypothetical protein